MNTRKIRWPAILLAGSPMLDRLARESIVLEVEMQLPEALIAQLAEISLSRQ